MVLAAVQPVRRRLTASAAPQQRPPGGYRSALVRLSASPCGSSLWMGGQHLPVRARSRRRCTGRARAVGAVRASASAACASCIPCLHEHAAPCVDAGARRLNEDKYGSTALHRANYELLSAQRSSRGAVCPPSPREAVRVSVGRAVHCGRRRSPGERPPAASMAASGRSSAGPRRLGPALGPHLAVGLRGMCIGARGGRCGAV